MNHFAITGTIVSVDLKNATILQNGQKVPVRIPTNLIIDLQNAQKLGVEIELKGNISASFLPLQGVAVTRIELVADSFSVVVADAAKAA